MGSYPCSSSYSFKWMAQGAVNLPTSTNGIPALIFRVKVDVILSWPHTRELLSPKLHQYHLHRSDVQNSPSRIWATAYLSFLPVTILFKGSRVQKVQKWGIMGLLLEDFLCLRHDKHKTHIAERSKRVCGSRLTSRASRAELKCHQEFRGCSMVGRYGLEGNLRIDSSY